MKIGTTTEDVPICSGCAERDARIEQLTIECRRIEEAKAAAEVTLHDLRRRRENPIDA